MEDLSRVRKHGFEWPFHPLQVVSWVVFGTDVALYSVFHLPLIGPVSAQVIVSVCYAISVVVLVVATYLATVCDPSDPRLRRRDQATESGDRDETESLSFCTMCAVQVHPRSKHCRACNKCVATFDHHCMWLNNCVGEFNYRAFFVTVSAVAVMIGIVLGTCVYLLIDYFANEQGFDERVHSIALFESLPNEFFLGLLICMCFVNTPLFLLDAQLVLLHIFLMSQQLTTYEYIMNKRIQMDERGFEDSEGKLGKAGADVARKIGRSIKTLPSCLDWIVFARCGTRRKRTKAGVERLGVPVQGSALGLPAEAPRDPEAAEDDAANDNDAGASRSASSAVRERPAEMPVAPSPPGSTAGFEAHDAESPVRDEASVATAQELAFSFEPEGGAGKVSGSQAGEELAKAAAAVARSPAASPPLPVATPSGAAAGSAAADALPSAPESPPAALMASKLGCGTSSADRPAGAKPAPAEL